MSEEKPIDTAIRFLKWHIANDYQENNKKGIPKGDWYNLKRFVEMLEEIRGKN